MAVLSHFMASNPKRLQTVQNTLNVIDALRELDGAGVSELASYLDMAPSTAHSYLSTLEDEEYLIKEGDIYYIGMQFLHVGGYARRRKRAYELAIDLVETLAKQTEERAQFTIEEHGQEVFLHTSSGERGVRLDARIGKRSRHLHCSATGKALLANLPRDRVETILDRTGLPTLTEKTITCKDELWDELERIREQGYSLNREEEIERMRAVGAPVLGPDDQVIGALSVSGPTKRMKGKRFNKELPNLIMGAANELELNITYS